MGETVSTKTILVTGDIVLDCHLYGAGKTAAASFSEPGTKYTERPGGAALTADLIRAAAEAGGQAWDEMEKAWRAQNEERGKNNKPPLDRPDNHPEERPSFKAWLALDTTNLGKDLPTSLRSFGVWTPHPRKKDSRDFVWRIANNNYFGYGPTEKEKSGCCFKRADSTLSRPPALTVIDDGGLLFRYEACKGVWPDLSQSSNGHFLLKMSGPLCRGELWAALAPVMDRLMVLVSARDLRREDAQINSRLSWEQCVEQTINALDNTPFVRDLGAAAHVIVSFDSAGALWYERGQKGGEPSYRLLFDSERLEGDYFRDFEGTVYGFQTCLVAGIVYHVMQHHTPPEQPGPLADQNGLVKAIELGIAAGLNARRELLELGHGGVGDPGPGYKDRSSARSIPNLLEIAKFKAVPVETPK